MRIPKRDLATRLTGLKKKGIILDDLHWDVDDQMWKVRVSYQALFMGRGVSDSDPHEALSEAVSQLPKERI